jgi:hypothetical protein
VLTAQRTRAIYVESRICAGRTSLYATIQTSRHVERRHGHLAGQRTHAHGSGGDSSMARGLDAPPQLAASSWRGASSAGPSGCAIGLSFPHRGVCGSLFRCIVYAGPAISNHSRRTMPLYRTTWRETTPINWTAANMALAPSVAYRAGRLLCSRVARPLRRQEDGQSLSPLSVPHTPRGPRGAVPD